MLAYELGWSGLMLDANRKAIEEAARFFAFNPVVRAVKARVSAGEMTHDEAIQALRLLGLHWTMASKYLMGGVVRWTNT